MRRSLETTIQDIVYNLDVGVGLLIIRRILYVALILLIMVLYTATQFRGLKDPEAMDMAQLARNFMMKGRWVTQHIRPASIWYLTRNSPSRDGRLREHPDIVHPPLYPLTLSAGFRLFNLTFVPSGPSRTFPPEQWVIVPINNLFSALTGLMIFLIARRLFDPRVAVLAATTYFLSDSVWGLSILGTAVPMATFWVTAAWYAAVVTVARYQLGGRPLTATGGAVITGALCALAFLTRYGTIAVAPAIALYLGLSLHPHGRRAVILFVLAFAVLIAPWLVRNYMVSGGPLGLAPLTVLNYVDPTVENYLERALTPDTKLITVLNILPRKLMAGLGELYNERLRLLGDGIITGFFFTTYFYSFAREPARRVRWCVAVGLALLVPLAALYGPPSYRLLHLFLPFVLIYSAAFFFILLDRLQLRIPLLRMMVVTAFLLLAALPLILRILPPRAGEPYPPYYPPYIVHVSRMLEPNELMCTDMPWATAWYGDRDSLFLPVSIDDFYEVHLYMRRVSGLYFTTLTRDRPYVRSLLTGPFREWFPLMEGRIPSDFPLTVGFPLGNLDQLFLTDRQRW